MKLFKTPNKPVVLFFTEQDEMYHKMYPRQEFVYQVFPRIEPIYVDVNTIPYIKVVQLRYRLQEFRLGEEKTFVYVLKGCEPDVENILLNLNSEE